MDSVYKIVTSPDIWERISEDGVRKEEFYPVTDALTYWLLCVEGNEIVGVILVHSDNSASVKIHPYLKKQFRKKGREMLVLFYEWFLIHAKENIHKVNACVPECYKSVINFAKKVGFKDEGFNRDSYLKNGILYGQVMLGITKSEIEDFLNGFNK